MGAARQAYWWRAFPIGMADDGAVSAPGSVYLR